MNKLAEETTLRIQKFFQKKSYTIEGFTWAEFDEYMNIVEADLLNDAVIDRTEEKEYNAIWDMIMYFRSAFGIYPKENCVIGFMGSVKKIWEQFYKERGGIIFRPEEKKITENFDPNKWW